MSSLESWVSDFATLPVCENDGGKGCNLKKLTQSGFRVPEGFVISAKAYQDMRIPVVEFSYADDLELNQQCETMVQRVLSSDLSERLRNEIDNALAGFSFDQRFAVRSSSTFEDLAGAAFAGQHETFLNVPKVEILQKVKECFASLWQKHAVLYRRRAGFCQSDASMAVVIQRCLCPESAGVAFSANPISGDMSTVLIEGNFGFGESVVGGEATTDSWLVKSESIVERRIGEKRHRVVAAESGTRDESVSDADARCPCLSDAQLLEVSRLAKSVEKAFQGPQDIEWAFENNTLFLLQARPQTTLPPHFTRDESAERFPDPITPLTWSFVSEAFDVSLEFSLQLIGLHLPTRPWFKSIDYYIYGNQNAVRCLSLFHAFPVDKLDQLIVSLPSIREKYRWVVELPLFWLSNLDVFLIEVGRLRSIDFSRFGQIGDFKEHIRALTAMSQEYFKPNIAISMVQGFLTKTIFEFLVGTLGRSETTHVLVKKVLAASNTKTSVVNRELTALARMVKRDPLLSKELAKGGSAFVPRVSQFPEFAAAFDEFLQRYGHREVTFDYYVPCWIDSPHILLDLIQATASASTEEDFTYSEELRRADAMECMIEIQKKIPKELHYLFNELIRLAQTYTWLDDLEHFQTTRINVLARRVVAALGERMRVNGSVDEPLDLFFLEKSELLALEGFFLSDDMKEKIRKRKSEFREAFQREPLWDLAKQENAHSVDPSKDLSGTPGSPGEFAGRVYVVRTPADFAGMPEGAVLVAKTTNPAWTPLFYKAGALITESGGPLSHGAVTAREVGIPAVMSVRSATQIFKNNEEVRVNGTAGRIERKV